MPEPAEIMIVAGEASGELYGAGLAEEIRNIRPDISIFGMGGRKMREAGVRVLYDVKDTAVLGLFEVVSKLLKIRSIFKGLCRQAADRRPIAAVLIDYPDFNLRLAARLKGMGIPVIYYMSPQIWAWRGGRIKKIKRYVSSMLVALPFEKDYYRKADVDVEFVGHPLVDIVRSDNDREGFFRRLGLDPRLPLIGLLPGSRRREIQLILPALARAMPIFRGKMAFQAVVAKADNIDSDEIKGILKKEGARIRVVEGHTYDLMKHARALVVASGSATLEAALLGTPMVVVYRTYYPSYWIGRPMISVEHFCLANLVLGERVVPELIQKDMNPENIARELERILCYPEVEAGIRSRLSNIKQAVGQGGAARKAAEAVLKLTAG